MYLTVCPLYGPGHDSSVGERMYLTVCPLYGPGHDSSVGERMYLTVCPLYVPGHDSSMGEQMNLIVCPTCGRGSAMAEYFKRFCVLSHGGRKWVNPPSMAPHSLWKAWRKAVVQQWMTEKKRIHINYVYAVPLTLHHYQTHMLQQLYLLIPIQSKYPFGMDFPVPFCVPSLRSPQLCFPRIEI